MTSHDNSQHPLSSFFPSLQSKNGHGPVQSLETRKSVIVSLVDGVIKVIHLLHSTTKHPLIVSSQRSSHHLYHCLFLAPLLSLLTSYCAFLVFVCEPTNVFVDVRRCVHGSLNWATASTITPEISLLPRYSRATRFMPSLPSTSPPRYVATPHSLIPHSFDDNDNTSFHITPSLHQLSLSTLTLHLNTNTPSFFSQHQRNWLYAGTSTGSVRIYPWPPVDVEEVLGIKGMTGTTTTA